MARLFGTDGVRGIANQDLTCDLAFKLGQASACVLASNVHRPTILVGRDTRISGEMLESALVAGICSMGGRAVLVASSFSITVATSFPMRWRIALRKLFAMGFQRIARCPLARMWDGLCASATPSAATLILPRKPPACAWMGCTLWWTVPRAQAIR